MTIDYADQFQPRPADIRYGGAFSAGAGAMARRITDAKSGFRSKLYRLTDYTLHLSLTAVSLLCLVALTFAALHVIVWAAPSSAVAGRGL
jgi:hypothetical protein